MTQTTNKWKKIALQLARAVKKAEWKAPSESSWRLARKVLKKGFNP